MTFTALTALLLFAGSQITADALENECAIVATEANARLAPAAAWSQVLLIKALDIKTVTVLAHVLVVWQIHDGGVVLVYDHDGTMVLATHSQKAKEIAAEINKENPTQPIFEASFIQ